MASVSKVLDASLLELGSVNSTVLLLGPVVFTGTPRLLEDLPGVSLPPLFLSGSLLGPRLFWAPF